MFSHDVTAAILVSQSNEAAAMLVSQTNPVGVELLSYANAFFCTINMHRCWPRGENTLYKFLELIVMDFCATSISFFGSPTLRSLTQTPARRGREGRLSTNRTRVKLTICPHW